MMYPFLKLNDNTEIVHSGLLENGRVKVYIKKPVDGGFYSAVCYLPDYERDDIQGFSEDDVNTLSEILEKGIKML